MSERVRTPSQNEWTSTGIRDEDDESGIKIPECEDMRILPLSPFISPSFLSARDAFPLLF